VIRCFLPVMRAADRRATGQRPASREQVVPCAPPVRIFRDARNQPGADRIFDHVLRMTSQRLAVANGMVEITSLPYRPASSMRTIDGVCASPFQQMHTTAERPLSQCEQPMQMIRHHDPGHRIDRTVIRQTIEFFRQDRGAGVIEKKSFAPERHCGNGIRPFQLGMTTQGETWTGHVPRMNRHPHHGYRENPPWCIG